MVWYSERNDDETWRDPQNAKKCKCLLPELIRPDADLATMFDEDGFGLSQLAGNVRVLGINRKMSLDEITDGSANTILIGEVSERLRPWCDPANVRDPADGINRVPWGFGGPVEYGGASFIFCDGSVKHLARDTNLDVMRALATPNGNEPISTDF